VIENNLYFSNLLIIIEDHPVVLSLPFHSILFHLPSILPSFLFPSLPLSLLPLPSTHHLTIPHHPLPNIIPPYLTESDRILPYVHASLGVSAGTVPFTEEQNVECEVRSRLLLMKSVDKREARVRLDAAMQAVINKSASDVIRVLSSLLFALVPLFPHDIFLSLFIFFSFHIKNLLSVSRPLLLSQ
jgi:hypothetical protein